MKQISANLTSVSFFPQGSMRESIIALHPNPITLDIMAMTPNVLKSQGEVISKAMEKGTRVNFLLTNGTAALIWNVKQKSFAEKLETIQAFQDKLEQTSCDHFHAKVVDWSPPVGLVIINSKMEDGLALVSVYTVDPNASSGEKTCFLLESGKNDDFLATYTRQFRALWQRGKSIDWQEKDKHLERVAITMKENTRKAIWNIEKAKNMDIAFVIALPEEFRFFRDVMGSMERLTDAKTGQVYYAFTCGEFSCVVLLLGKMGKMISAQMAERMLHRFNVGTVVSIGIAGSARPDNINEGDVVVASRVTDFFHRSEVKDHPSKEGVMDFTILLGGSSYQTTQQLVSWAMHLEFSHQEIFANWKGICKNGAEKVLKTLDDPLDPDEAQKEKTKEGKSRLGNTRLHADDIQIATLDMVVSSNSFVKWLQASDRNISVIEMESSGVVHTVMQNLSATRCMVVRGISDLADEGKSKTDVYFAGSNRRISMKNATELIKTMLENQLLPLGSEECPGYMGDSTS